MCPGGAEGGGGGQGGALLKQARLRKSFTCSFIIFRYFGNIILSFYNSIHDMRALYRYFIFSVSRATLTSLMHLVSLVSSGL